MRVLRAVLAGAVLTGTLIAVRPPTGTAAPATGTAAAPPTGTAGVLSVASDISYPPFESYDARKHPQGLDVDVATAIAKRLSLRLDYHEVGWDDLIPTITGHGADLVMSAMTDDAERQRKLTYVDYLVEGSQTVVAKGNPAGITGIDGICGHRVAVGDGTVQADLVQAQAGLCVRAGRPAVRVDLLDTGSTYDRVTAGTDEALVDGYTAAAENAGSGPFQLAGLAVEASPMGIGFAHDRLPLRHAVQLALRDMITDGTYKAILNRYGLAAEALTTAAIDGGV